MIKVILADDHSLIREGIKRILDSEGDIKIVAETGDPLNVLDLIKKHNCDVLMLDISMPQKSGLDVLKDVVAFYPKVKVLILTMMPEDQFAKRTLKAGAFGYLKKDSSPEEMITAVRRIASGKKYVSEAFAENLINGLDKEFDVNLHELLSDREYQVFSMIAKGNSQSEIADKLCISISSVNTYRARILEKLELQSNADIIHYAYRNKLLV